MRCGRRTVGLAVRVGAGTGAGNVGVNVVCDGAAAGWGGSGVCVG